MTIADLFSVIALIAVIAWVGRGVPLPPRRRALVMACRIAALLCLSAALKGWSWPRRVEQPRQIVYALDQSASIREDQTRWMARLVASIEARRPRAIRRAVVAFGERARVIVPAERDPLADPDRLANLLTAASLPRENTNLESALLAGLGAMASPASTRVILMTDGRQTSGSVDRVLGYVRRLGMEVYPVAVPPSAPAAVVWDQLVAPAVVQPGSSAQLKIVLINGTGRSRPIDLTVDFEGLTLTRQRVSVRPGWQVVSLAVPAVKAGTVPLDVSIAGLGSGDEAGVVQHRRVMIEVEGRPQLLMVADQPRELPPLGAALKRRQMDVAVMTTAELPTESGPLLEYDAIILYQTTKSAFTAEQVAALEDYVERFGGGLVSVGLGGKLDEEITREAPLDALLPVKFEPKGLQEAKRRVCMVMLIDRSASMMGPRIAATKRAAVELVRQLAPEDLVGVLAFDTMPYVVAEVQPARQVSAALIDKLVRLKSTGGTDIFPALKAAQSRLQASGATVKHIMLLSDGNTPFEARAYRQLLMEMKQQRITMSTIGIGSVMVNVDFLRLLALETGGTYYQLNSLDELPQLVARDTEQALGNLPFTEGYFRPEASETSQWFEGIREWPVVKGYLTTTLKPEAVLELGIRQRETRKDAAATASEVSTVETIHPLLGWWPRGKGRVAAFTSDAEARWSPEWVRWPYFESVWAQAMRSIMRSRIGEEVFVWLDEQADYPHVVIEGRLVEPTASFVSPDGMITPLSLVQASPFRWRAAVGHLEHGWYQLLLESRGPPRGRSEALPSSSREQAVTFARRWIRLGDLPSGGEMSGVAPDEMLLARIAQATGGYVNLPDRAFVPPTEPIQRPVSLRPWLLPLVLLLLLLDVALRGRTLL